MLMLMLTRRTPSEGGIILVVDDEPDIRLALAAMIKRRLPGAVVVQAGDGEEARDALEATDVDLIVTDYRMPHMDGLELMRHVRDSYPDIPAIMLTAFTDVEIERRARDFGVQAFFSKPFDVTKLVQTMDELMAP